MTNTTEEYELDACQDCLIWIANADGSGMEEADLDELLAGIERNWAGFHLIAVGNELGFTARDCEVCCREGHGDRFRVIAVPRS